MAAPILFGSEFRVNTTVTGNQDSSSVAALANGKFVVVWESDTSGNNEVRGQIYNADGSKFGGEMAIANDGATGGFYQWNQQRPVVTGTGDGRFVVAWEDYFAYTGDPVIPDIRARVFNGDGTLPPGVYANEILVNSNEANANTAPAIGAFTSPANGRFLVSWTTLTDGAFESTDISARAFNAAAASSSSQTNVDDFFPQNESQPASPMEIMSSSGPIPPRTLPATPTISAHTSAPGFSAPCPAARSQGSPSSPSTG